MDGQIATLTRQVNQLKTQMAARTISRPRIEAQHWSQAVSATLALSGLRGCWPTSIQGGSPITLRDISTNAMHMTRAGNPVFHRDGQIFYVYFDGTSDHYYVADQADLDILGTESYNATSARGLSFGCWCNLNAGVDNIYGLMAKWDTTNNRSYAILINADEKPVFYLSMNGVAFLTVTSSVALEVNKWYWVAARYDPSNTMDIFVNTTKTTLDAGVYASVFNSTARLEFGHYTGVDRYLNFDGSLFWLSSHYLTNAQMTMHFEMTRACYEVY